MLLAWVYAPREKSKIKKPAHLRAGFYYYWIRRVGGRGVLSC
jgi:hypothetical protein